MVVDWHYVQLKEVDRIALNQDRQIHVEPTNLTIVEKIFPSGTTKEEVLDACQNLEVLWTETLDGVEFYCSRKIGAINLLKRYKNVWVVKTYLLKKDKKKGKIVYNGVLRPVGVFELESIAHAVNEKYWANQAEIYPNAGTVTDYLTDCKR